MKRDTAMTRKTSPALMPLLLLATLATAGEAAAISRYTSTTLTCEAARDKVLREGAVIFRHGSTRVPGMTLYDRFVRGARYCNSHEIPVRATVPTRDRDRCPMLVCRPYDPEDTVVLPPRF